MQKSGMALTLKVTFGKPTSMIMETALKSCRELQNSKPNKWGSRIWKICMISWLILKKKDKGKAGDGPIDASGIHREME
ncbi:MAG: hypothetical protein Q7J85_11025 [Bacillota bacterium]|nr:hypothetical protein [Bacillota bacterium]